MSRVSVRYIIDDVPAAIRFYTELLGFTVEHDASPASPLESGIVETKLATITYLPRRRSDG